MTVAVDVVSVLAARVAKGAALLDTYVPDWAQRLAVVEIRMESVRQDVVGHLFGEYLSGLEKLDALVGHHVDEADYGFSYEPALSDEMWRTTQFDELGKLWRAEVKKRTQVAVASEA